MPSRIPKIPKVVKVGFDDFKPTPAHELTDLATLPRRFDLFAGEMRDAFTSLGKQLLPMINRIEVTQQQQSEALRAALAELAAVKAEQAAVKVEQAAQRARIAALEAANSKKRRSTPQKETP